MRISKVFRLMVRPKKLFAYLQMQQELKLRYSVLSRVTRLESVQDLHDKIRNLQARMDAL
jgi:hypothetical protein